MKKRQSTVQKFSSFLSFSDVKEQSTLPQWMVDPKLERTIIQLTRSQPERPTEEWALYFLSILQTESEENSQHTVAAKYVSAFLQEVCYQAAQKLQRQFQSVQYQYSLADLFQIGNVFANQPVKLFRSFRSSYPCSSLESYARTAIFRFIGNTIYTQDLEAKREKFSDYGLLRDLSGKELREALASTGLQSKQIEAHCFARQCYSAVCQPQMRHSSRTLSTPTQEELTEIAHCYNQQFNQLTQLADPILIQAMLSTCIEAARHYRTNRVIMLEDDDVVSDTMMTPWETIIQTEEREQMQSLVSERFALMPEMGQRLLKCWLGLNLTQTEIATAFSPKYLDLQKQYQVARQIGKYNRNFLKDFIQQCQRLNPDLAVQDDSTRCSADTARVELIQHSLEDCLQAHCKRLVWSDLEQVQQSNLRSQLLPELVQAVTYQLEHNLALPAESLRFVSGKIAEVVDEWQRFND